jgi:energy-coupling factor transporter ATP-binding protein EcfA2
LFPEFRKKRSNNILFLLDEPASNLHSSAQLKILDAIKELSNGSIVIYSTHSHHLINPEWLSGAYVIINDLITDKRLLGNAMNIDDGAKITAQKYFTYVGKGKGSTKTSYFQPILDRLDYLPSYVEPIPNIVITEGKNDWYTFKYFSEIVISSKYNLNFYPGAGRNQLWDIIRLYLSWGKKFLVILDGDEPGIKAKNEYIKEFDEFIKTKILTLQDIFHQKYMTEDLIDSVDQKQICNKIFGNRKYESVKTDKDKLKSILNYAIMQLLINKEKIAFSNKTVNNFKTLFKALTI